MNYFETLIVSFGLFCYLACVATYQASVPVRSERNLARAKEFFAFGPREKLLIVKLMNSQS